MKSLHALVFGLAVAVFGVALASLNAQQGTTLTPLSERSPGSVEQLGKPAFSGSQDGIKADIWIVTAEKHKQIQGGSSQEPSVPPKRNSDELYPPEGNDPQGMKAPALGNPSGDPTAAVIVVKIADAAKGTAINDAKLEVSMVSPGNKKSDAVLTSMKDHYAHDLDMAEKGQYKFTLTISRKDAKATTMNFNASAPSSVL